MAVKVFFLQVKSVRLANNGCQGMFITSCLLVWLTVVVRVCLLQVKSVSLANSGCQGMFITS